MLMENPFEEVVFANYTKVQDVRFTYASLKGNNACCM